jgi:hypothetical protein
MDIRPLPDAVGLRGTRADHGGHRTLDEQFFVADNDGDGGIAARVGTRSLPVRRHDGSMPRLADSRRRRHRDAEHHWSCVNADGGACGDYRHPSHERQPGTELGSQRLGSPACRDVLDHDVGRGSGWQPSDQVARRPGEQAGSACPGTHAVEPILIRPELTCSTVRATSLGAYLAPPSSWASDRSASAPTARPPATSASGRSTAKNDPTWFAHALAADATASSP